MKLGEKQEHFSESLCKLLQYAKQKRIKVRLRELWRTKEQAEIYAAQGKGILNSNHRNGLAIDLYVRAANGEVVFDGPLYLELARYWKSLSTAELEHCWGGDFKRRDVYHYSIKHGGVV